VLACVRAFMPMLAHTLSLLVPLPLSLTSTLSHTNIHTHTHTHSVHSVHGGDGGEATNSYENSGAAATVDALVPPPPLT
jgi:hypothetical protein